MLTNCCKLKIVAIIAAIAPETSVEFTGVLVRLFTLLKNAYNKPSEDIAYNTRANGNIAPNRHVHKANTAPIDTILFMRKKENN